MKDSKPPLFTYKSLMIITKVVAIFAAFYIVTAMVKVYSDPLSEQPTRSTNAYDPMYVVAGIHFVVLIATGATIVLRKYNWVVALLGAAAILLSRIFYQDIALWVWSWSA